MKLAALVLLPTVFLASCRCLFNACENTVEVVVDSKVASASGDFNGGYPLTIDIVPIPGVDNTGSPILKMTPEAWFEGNRGRNTLGANKQTWTVDGGIATFRPDGPDPKSDAQDVRPQPFNGADRDLDTWALVIFADFRGDHNGSESPGIKKVIHAKFLDKARRILIKVKNNDIVVSKKKPGS